MRPLKALIVKWYLVEDPFGGRYTWRDAWRIARDCGWRDLL